MARNVPTDFALPLKPMIRANASRFAHAVMQLSKMSAPPVKIETNHRGDINDCEVNMRGDLMATCSSDNTIKIFKIDSSNRTHTHQIAELTGHTAPVWSISWAMPSLGTYLASAGYDGLLIVWKDDESWTKLYTYDGHTASVNIVKFAPAGYGQLIVACGSSDGDISIHYYEESTGQWTVRKIPKAHPQGVNSLSWAPVTFTKEGIIRPPNLASCGNEKAVKVWAYDHSGDWSLLEALFGHNDFVRDVEWCPLDMSGEFCIASVGDDSFVYVFRTICPNKKEWTTILSERYDARLVHVSWNSSGTLLAIGGEDDFNVVLRRTFMGHFTKTDIHLL